MASLLRALLVTAAAAATFRLSFTWQIMIIKSAKQTKGNNILASSQLKY